MEGFMEFGESADGGGNDQFDFGGNDQMENLIGTEVEGDDLNNQIFQQDQGVHDSDLFGESNSNENNNEVEDPEAEQVYEKENDEEENENNLKDLEGNEEGEAEKKENDEVEEDKNENENVEVEEEEQSSLFGENEDNDNSVYAQMDGAEELADESNVKEIKSIEQENDAKNDASQLRGEPMQKRSASQEVEESTETQDSAKNPDFDKIEESKGKNGDTPLASNADTATAPQSEEQGAESVSVGNNTNDLNATTSNGESFKQEPDAKAAHDESSQNISSSGIEQPAVTEASALDQSPATQTDATKDYNGNLQNENINADENPEKIVITEQKSNLQTAAGDALQEEENLDPAKSMGAAIETTSSLNDEEMQNASAVEDAQPTREKQSTEQTQLQNNENLLDSADQEIGNNDESKQDIKNDIDSNTNHEILENNVEHNESQSEPNNEPTIEGKAEKESLDQIHGENLQEVVNPPVSGQNDIDESKENVPNDDQAKDVDMDNGDLETGNYGANAGANHAASSIPIKISNSESSLKSVDMQENESSEPIDPSIPQTHDVVIPSYSCWFDLTKIHSIEKENLPEFFTNRIVSKTPQIYIKYRNFMVNTYRISPDEYFTFTSARRNLCGDSGCIFRIHKFLNRWGLINYQVDAQKKPANIIEPPSTKDFEVKHDAPRGLFPFQSYKPSVQLPDLIRLKKLMNQELQKSNSVDPEQPPLKKRKTSLQMGDVKAETHSQYETNTNAKDNAPDAVVISNDSAETDGWSAEEETKLVKLISDQTLSASKPLTSDIWVTASNLLGNKTPQECILKFLQLPLEDPFLMGQENGSQNGIGPLKYAPYLPFSKADNPVLSTIAFLVGLCDPSEVKKMVQHITKDYDTFNDNNKPTLKDGVHFGLSALGIRARHFADNGEKELLDVTNRLVHAQMQKVDLKLEKLKVLEKSLTLKEHYFLQERQKFIFEKLQFYKEYENLVSKLDDGTKQKPDLRKHLDILAPNLLKPSAAKDATKEKQESGEDEENIEDSLPISVSAPQFYRYWSG